MSKKYGPRHSHVYTGGQPTAGLPFQGELMTCVMCEKTQQSDPAVESGWTKIEVDGVGYYVCPAELPGASGTKQAFADAYERVFGRITERQKGGD